MQRQWEEATPLSWARFENPGDGVMGQVVEYDPYRGTTDFNGAECGLLVLLQDDGEQVQISLDKNALRDAIKGCRPESGLYMAVRFAQWRTSKNGRDYKEFQAHFDPATRAPGRSAPEAAQQSQPAPNAPTASQGPPQGNPPPAASPWPPSQGDARPF